MKTSAKFDEASKILRRYVLLSMGISLIPLPIVDLAGLWALQLAMLSGVSHVYGERLADEWGKKTIATLLGGLTPITFYLPMVSVLQVVPFIGFAAAFAGMPVLAGAATYAVGMIFIRHFELGGSLATFDANLMKTQVRAHYEEGKQFAAATHSEAEKAAPTGPLAVMAATQTAEPGPSIDEAPTAPEPTDRTDAAHSIEEETQSAVGVASSETAPAETAPAETAPAETAPAETAPAETAPDETAPDETAPVETAPVETAPVETAPAVTPLAETAPPAAVQVLRFDGLDDYISLPKMEVDFSQGITVEAWVCYESFKYWSRIIDFGNGAESDNIVLANSAGTANLMALIRQGNQDQQLAAANCLEIGKWLYVAIVVDATGRGALYVDGHAVAEDQMLPPLNLKRSQNYIGRSNAPNDGYFHGRMCELRLWNTPRSTADILSNQDGRLTGGESGLVGYWPLTEVDADGKTPDLSANNNPGTIHGAQIVPAADLVLGAASVAGAATAAVAGGTAAAATALPLGAGSESGDTTLMQPGVQYMVYHGQHTHVNGKYAKDAALTIILNTHAPTEGPGAIVCISWDENAAGVRNATAQLEATVSREGDTLIVRSKFYCFKGQAQGNHYEGQYFNPSDKLCGNFKLASLGLWM